MATDPVIEIRDRTRRIEMRLTTLMEAQNIETGVHRPVWSNGVVHIPSRMSSLRDVLAAVPETWPRDREIELRMKDVVLGKLKVT